MLLAERYIFSNVFKPMMFALAIGLGLLIAVRIILATEFAFAQSDALGTLLRTVLYWLPFYLGLAIPISVLCGLLFGFERMVQARELVVLQATGLTPHKMMRPAVLLTVLATVLATLIYGWLDPLTTYARRLFNHHLENTAAYFLVEEDTFMKFGSSVVMLQDLDRSTGEFGKIFIYRILEPDFKRTVTAKRGNFRIDKYDGRHVLNLRDVVLMEARHETLRSPNPHEEEPKYRVAAGNELVTDIGQKPRPFRLRGRDQKEWTLPELFAGHIDGVTPVSDRKIYVELHFRLGEITLVSILPFLALIFSGFRDPPRMSYRAGFGVIALILAYSVLLYGTRLADAFAVSPFLTIWAPLASAILFIFLRCFLILYKPPGQLALLSVCLRGQKKKTPRPA